MRGARLFLALLAFALLPVTSHAQQSSWGPILVIEMDRLLQESRPGQEVLRQNNADREARLAEGRAASLSLEQEERELTELRQSLDPAEFRELAQAFDEKVIATRREQEQLDQEFTRRADERVQSFYNEVVAPLIDRIADETDAMMIVHKEVTLVNRVDLNITAEVIKRLDASIPESPAPEPGASDN